MHILLLKELLLLQKQTIRFIDIRNRFSAFKNNTPFTNCISKINNVLIDNAEDLDIVMPMYNLKITKKQHVVCGIITEMN